MSYLDHICEQFGTDTAFTPGYNSHVERITSDSTRTNLGKFDGERSGEVATTPGYLSIPAGIPPTIEAKASRWM